ncbi:HIT-like domain-containing protein [Morchella snyderi]|nr:HIT-like domain-containing protein [Morchella snyderi]
MAAVKPVYFGAFLVTSQVFYRTAHSFALVNLKPLLPGHVLVCPNRVVPRLKDLSTEEVTDLFLTVQKIGKAVERLYKADSLNIAMQDGAAAGQSVPHVHTHIIPRQFQDLEKEDQIYTMLESDDGDLLRNYLEARHPSTLEGSKAIPGHGPAAVIGDTNNKVMSSSGGGRPKFPTLSVDGERKARSEGVMREEAEWLAKCLKEQEEEEELC